MLTVCIGSFYLSILIIMIMKDLLIFVGLKYTDGNVDDIIKIMIIIDFIVLFTIPLLMQLTGTGVC